MRLSDLCAPLSILTPLDQGRPATNEYERRWRDDGFLILERFIPNDVVDAYCAWRGKKSPRFDDTPSYSSPDANPLKDLCLNHSLMEIIRDLLGEEAALQFNLLQWVSSERNWHMDTYLNSVAAVGSFYLAVWFALDDINPDCGPFEYIPGSHRIYQFLSHQKVITAMKQMNIIKEGDNNPWPKESEKLLDDLVENEIKTANLPVRQFLGKKGDVLIWHCNLIHRGARAKVPGMLRKACIAHYSGINHRPDAHDCRQHTTGGRYFMMNYPVRKNRVTE